MPLSALLVSLLAAAAAVVIPVSAQAAAPSATHAAATVSSAPASLPTAEEAAQSGITLVLAPATSAAVGPNQDLPVTATITNSTTSAMTTAQLDLYLAEDALTTRSMLDSWLRPEATSGTPGDLMLSQPLAITLQPGHSTTIDLTVPAASIGLTTANPWGARGIAATLTSADGVRVDARSTFVWSLGESVAPVTLTLVVPITVPAGSAGENGLLSAETLATLTGPLGQLTRKLDATFDRPTTLAIDPMIIASIRILGSSAPASAVNWLERLANSLNDSFALSYADADIALEAQAGAPALLAPISFDQAIDPTLFTGPAVDTEPTEAPAAPGAPVAPSPTPTLSPVVPPTSADLLDWNYSTTGLGWPGAGTVSVNDLNVFADSGIGSVLLSSNNVNRPDSTLTPNAAVLLGRTSGLVSDSAVETALRAAASAVSDDTWRAAMAEASAQLAVVAAEQPATARTLLATFDRSSSSTPLRLGQTIQAVNELTWQKSGTIADARASTPTAGTNFASRSEPDTRTATAQRLLSREAALTAFSSSLNDPLALTGPQRLNVLTLLSASWAPEPVAWESAVAASMTGSADILQSITVTTKGPVNVVSSKVDIPVSLGNSLNQAVSVRVQVVPSNGRLLVGGVIDATIDANSARIVNVPVTAAVGNGEVTLRVALSTPDGTPIGAPAEIAVNVRADWESLGTLLFALLVVLFFGFGIVRNIIRRRRERHTKIADQDDSRPVEESAQATPTEQVTDGSPDTPVAPAPPAPRAPDSEDAGDGSRG
ncbi:hypothetical protein GCM10027056_27410 [Glaciibacter psychrotolerans]